jgi:hypothetical protein
MADVKQMSQMQGTEANPALLVSLSTYSGFSFLSKSTAASYTADSFVPAKEPIAQKFILIIKNLNYLFS